MALEKLNKQTAFLSYSIPVWEERGCEQSSPSHRRWVNPCGQWVLWHYTTPFFPFPEPRPFTRGSLHGKENSRVLLGRIGVPRPKFLRHAASGCFSLSSSPYPRALVFVQPYNKFCLWSVIIIALVLINETWGRRWLRMLLCKALTVGFSAAAYA